MITNPNDYAFVDFSGGLPTGRFCADGIMPLRRAKCLPMAQDVAFLAECVRDKLGAFRGITQNGVPIGDTDPGKFTPTWKFQASQMENLRTTLSYALSGANFHKREPAGANSFVGVGLLGQQLPPGNDFLDQPERETSDDGLDDFMRDVLYPRYGLNDSPSIGSFKRGDVPLESWVLHMYDDAKKLMRPVIIIENSLESILAVDKGEHVGPISPVDGVLGWSMVDRPGVQQYDGYIEWTTPNDDAAQTIAVIPDAFISGADAWLVYDAYNSVSWKGGGNTIRRRTGIINLAGAAQDLFFAHSDQLGAYVLNAVHGARGDRALFEEIVGDLGWTLYHLSKDEDGVLKNDDGVLEQYVNITYSSRFIIAGTPNGRTQWWD